MARPRLRDDECHITVRTSKALKARLEEESIRRVVSTNLLITNAIEHYLARLVPVDEILEKRKFKNEKDDVNAEWRADHGGGVPGVSPEASAGGSEHEPTRFEAYLQGGGRGPDPEGVRVHVDVPEPPDGPAAEVSTRYERLAAGHVDQPGAG